MALSDKNILITPARGAAADPTIVFSGANVSVGPQNITATALPLSNGTVSFTGSAGQLFSITNSLTGSIFSVNDVSGIPSIEVNSSGVVSMAQYGGNVGIGTASPGQKLSVVASGSSRIEQYADSNHRQFVYNNAVTGAQASGIGQGGFLSRTSAGTWSGTKSFPSFPSYSMYMSNEANQGISFVKQDAGSTQTDGTISEFMRIDASGRVTTPLQPFFMGQPTVDYSSGGMPTGTMSVTALYNNGGHFSAATNRFTAPVTGWYLSTWGGLQLPATVTSLQVNGARTYNGNHFPSTTPYITMTQQVVRSLNAGDFLSIEQWNGGGYYNAWWLWTVQLVG